ncbi:MAG: AmmeMemoRadiSam system protein A [Verrucomicrobia bacterium]|jgi:AmmeMemoRadiSam system protein A|nr:AmmeMemoRadiSam system protein A [Verrucomicrobiota bacterium]
MALTPESPPPLQCSVAEQQLLIGLAHEAIHNAIHGRKAPEVPPESLTPTLRQHAASFVTLTLIGKLRGCVGNLTAQEPAYLSVMHNAVGAALRDRRFDPVNVEEATRVSVHISLLSALGALRFNSTEELLDQLTPGRDGVVLRRSGRTATYLPQVWESLPEKHDFLNSLSRKAGLEAEAWRDPEAELLVYRAASFGDSDGA